MSILLGVWWPQSRLTALESTSRGGESLLPRLAAFVADRGYTGLGRRAGRHNLKLDMKQPPKGTVDFMPLAPLYRVENALARLGRWRRLSRCYEGCEKSAKGWLEVAAVAYTGCSPNVARAVELLTRQA